MAAITALTPYSGARTTKYFHEENGSIDVTPYPDVKYWYHATFNISSVAKYHEQNWDGSVLIRGMHKHPCHGRFSDTAVRRTSEVFQEYECCWIMIDVDGYAAPCTVGGAEQYIKKELPPGFRDAACSVQFSASAGIYHQGEPLKGGLNCHLTFFLNRPLRNQQIKHWLKDCKADLSLYTPVQPHYVTDPVIGEGVDLRLKERKAFIEGNPEVKVPDIAVPEPPPYTSPPHIQSRITLRDIAHCQFISHVIENGVEGYVLTRAFCHNVALLQNSNEIINRTLSGYKHEEAIRRSLSSFDKPILCKTIVEEGGFDCPHFQNDSCKTGARAPIAIAGRGIK